MGRSYRYSADLEHGVASYDHSPECDDCGCSTGGRGQSITDADGYSLFACRACALLIARDIEVAA